MTHAGKPNAAGLLCDQPRQLGEACVSFGIAAAAYFSRELEMLLTCPRCRDGVRAAVETVSVE